MKKIILTTIILAGFSAQASPGEYNSGKGCKKISTCTEIIGACEIKLAGINYFWKFNARVHSVYQCLGDVSSELRNSHLRGDYEDTVHERDRGLSYRPDAFSECEDQKRRLNKANGCPEFLLKL